jgi:hypothetical protein
MYPSQTGLTSLTSSRVSPISPLPTTVNWQAQPQELDFIPMEAISDPPNIIGMGDSLTSGHSGNQSFVTQSASPSVNLSNQWTGMLADNYGWTWHNVGITGERLDQGITRFVRDVVRQLPKACTIWYGTNDLNFGKTANEMFASAGQMMDLCVANNIIPIILSATPYSSGSDALHAVRRDYNTQIESFAGSHGAIVINIDAELGVLRGSTGFNDDLNPLYNTGDGHYTTAGYVKLVQVVTDTLNALSNTPVAESITVSDSVLTTKITAPVCGFAVSGFTSTGFTICVQSGLRPVSESLTVSDVVSARGAPFVDAGILHLGDFEVDTEQ